MFIIIYNHHFLIIMQIAVIIQKESHILLLMIKNYLMHQFQYPRFKSKNVLLKNLEVLLAEIDKLEQDEKALKDLEG